MSNISNFDFVVWSKFWKDKKKYVSNYDCEKKYCIAIPPPNITGRLHMGHAFQCTIMDLLIRYYKMKGFSTAVNMIVKKGDVGSYYHLIVLNSLAKKVTVTPFRRDDFKSASDAYSKAEAETAKDVNKEVVLVSAGPISVLRKAYPNFFLDIGDFVGIITDIIY